MDQDTLFETLVRWNYWGKKSFESLQMRKVMTQIFPYINEAYPIVVIGIRRSGKSNQAPG